MKKTAIVGAGITGLTTAIQLQEAGYQVEIITERLPLATVSAVAAAIWLPFNMGPQQLANQWAKESYAIFEFMAQQPETGVSMVDLEVWVEEEVPPWAEALPAGLLTKLETQASPVEVGYGFEVRVPLIESPIYLPYLLARFKANRGLVITRKIHDLASLTEKYERVINCTGLGAKPLLNDKEMYPIRGQLLKLAPQSMKPLIVDFPVPGSSDQLIYIIPRQDGLLLGGTAERGDWNQQVQPELTITILDRVVALYPALAGLELQRAYAGLRPGRCSIRLEREGNIIHNYGHGGGGYTVSWGCAKAVLALIS